MQDLSQAPSGDSSPPLCGSFVVVRCVVVLRGCAVVLTGGRALGLLVLMVFTGAGAFLGEAELVEFLGARHKPGKSEEHEVPSGHSEHA